MALDQWKQLLEEIEKKKQAAESEYNAISPQEQEAIKKQEDEDRMYKYAQGAGSFANAMGSVPTRGGLLFGINAQRPNMDLSEMAKPQESRKDVLSRYQALKDIAQRKAQGYGDTGLGIQEKSIASDIANDLEMKKFNRQQEWDMKKINAQLDKEISREERKQAREESPEYKLTHMSDTAKQLQAQAKSGIDAVEGMDKALAAGDNTFSLIGDNDFTRNQRIAAEMFGRIQSGGAINKDEEDRFLKMGPRPTDSKEQQIKKIAQQRELFIQRLKSNGIPLEMQGVNEKYSQQYQLNPSNKNSNVVIKESVAKENPQIDSNAVKAPEDMTEEELLKELGRSK